jgi:hypothetical protein
MTTTGDPLAVTERTGGGRRALRRLGALLAYVAWWAAAACGVVLAVGALLVALGVDEQRPVVSSVLSAADLVDLGVLDRDRDWWGFEGPKAALRTSLLNWGLAALCWLLAGRAVDQLLRPPARSRS